MIVQIFKKGNILPEKFIVIDNDDSVVTFPSASEFSLDLKGESLRVVTSPVTHQMFQQTAGKSLTIFLIKTAYVTPLCIGQYFTECD